MKKVLFLGLMCLLFAMPTQAATHAGFTVGPTVMCAGEPVHITNTTSSTVPVTYHWYLDGSDYGWGWTYRDVPTLHYGGGGSFTVQLVVYDSVSGAFIDSHSESLVVYNPPSVSLTTSPLTPTLSCATDSINLIASSADTAVHRFVWTLPSGVTDSHAVYVARVPGVYMVRSIGSHGCMSYAYGTNVYSGADVSTQVYLSVPFYSTEDTVRVCSATNPVLYTNTWGGNPPFTLSWNTGSSAPYINPVLTTGKYKFTVTDTHGCKATDSMYVVVNPTPSVAITASSSALAYCVGDTVTLSVPAIPGATYSWNTGSTNDSIQITSSGWFTVYATGPGGCTNYGSYNAVYNSTPSPAINVYPSPGGSIGGDTVNICTNVSTTMSAYSMSYSPGFTTLWSTGSTVSSFPVSTSGTYSVTLTDLDGCSASKRIYVRAYGAPDSTISMALSGTLCSGQMQVLRLPPGNLYSWNTGSPLDSIVITSTGYYEAFITSPHGCASHARYNAVFYPTPTPAIAAAPCSMNVAVVDAGASYQWYMLTSPIPGATGTFHAATASNYYSVKETSSAGCTSFAPSTYVTCGSTSGGSASDSIHANFIASASLLCHAGNVTFTNITGLSDSTHITYAWTFDGGTPASSTLKNPPAIHYGTAGIHSVALVVRDTTSGAVDSHTATVRLDTMSILAYGTSAFGGYSVGLASFCANTDPHAGVTVYTGNAPTYIWSTGSSTAVTVSAYATGEYRVIVTDSFGCAATDSVHIVLYAAPDSAVAESPAGVHCPGDTVTLALAAGNTYLWNSADTARTLSVTAAGSHSATITNAHGCVSHTPMHGVAYSLPPAPSISAFTCSMGVVAVDPLAAYQWYLGSSAIAGATTETYVAVASGYYKVSEMNMDGCIGYSASLYDTACTPPTVPDTCMLYPQSEPTIIVGSGTCLLSADITAASYEWSLDGIVVPASNTQTLSVAAPGFYTVRCSNAYGCTSASHSRWASCTTAVSDLAQGTDIELFPNPATETITVSLGKPGTFDVSVSTMLGQTVAHVHQSSANESKLAVSIHDLPTGMYMVTIAKDGAVLKNAKVIKQ